MNLDDHDTPPGYVDAMENATLAASEALFALRAAPPVEVPASVMFAGSWDQWRDVEFDAAGDPIDPPTFAVAASTYAATDEDGPVIAEAVQTMLTAAMAVPPTAEVGASLHWHLDLLRERWIAHRLTGVVGTPARDRAELIADDAFARNHDLAVHVVNHAHTGEQAA